ncbi:MAG: phage/plasmid primase, P4 family [Patescibacteria group bacterium]
MKKDTNKFLDNFPDHVYRYIDQTGLARSPVSSATKREDLNLEGYEAYFTVNGFKNAPDAKKEHCSSLNAFFVDIDGRKDEKELQQIIDRCEPTFILETLHGYHIYWLLDEVIYRDDMTKPEWDEAVARWEKIEQNIVATLKADPVVKDVPRILRQANTYYWKKSEDVYKKGVAFAPFKIKGLHKNLVANYSMDQMVDAFPFPVLDVVDSIDYSERSVTNDKRFGDAEKRDFFERVNKLYPLEERPSFVKLIDGSDDSSLPRENCANSALVVTASLMRQAGWSKAQALKHLETTGWHGIEKERGGKQEIISTVTSAYNSGYTYSYKNEFIAYNTTHEEQQKIQSAYTAVAKDRKDLDKTRFANYEYEIVAKYPYLKKNEAGFIFNYDNGVYRIMSDQEISNLVLSCLYEDMLWGYRNRKSVSDKVACLLSIIPDLVITDDKGFIVNVKNGLLNIISLELKPHTPNYVSLIQLPVVYDPKAKCPIWNECMDMWMEGEEAEDKKTLLQQFTGYCLSSSTKQSKALFTIGDGGNGKSTFADTIAMVIGDKATSHLDLDTLYSSFGFEGLIGKRLNVVEEVSGNYYESHKLKKLISGEEITINVKYKPQFKFRPQAKFIFANNTMPRVDDSSSATERRICAVQFNNNYRNNPNTELRYASGLLAKELPGILNWMLEGAKKLRDMGKFVVTEEQRTLLSEYRQENSSTEGFIAECLEFEEGSIMTTRDLYDTYVTFCKKDGRKFKSNIAFIKELRAFGSRNMNMTFIPRKGGNDQNKFEGVKLNDEWKKVGNPIREFQDF